MIETLIGHEAERRSRIRALGPPEAPKVAQSEARRLRQAFRSTTQSARRQSVDSKADHFRGNESTSTFNPPEILPTWSWEWMRNWYDEPGARPLST